MSVLEEPIDGAMRTAIGGLVADEVVAGRARVKRMIYPPGWRWSVNMAPVVGSERCMHAHVGFLVQGSIAVEYDDGCRVEYTAPAPIVVEPGHDGWVLGDQAAVMVQVDCDTETVDRFGLTGSHHH
jgi:hypothetical protein